ncbi:MAG: hypothetical protein M1839_002121 [Geoglossum umbratile]|nr:MAG: hypothetical protein M1839_002121 [Geoglossum umbratile]
MAITIVPTHDTRGRSLVPLDTLSEPRRPVALEDRVWKRGRTTGFTRGMVSQLKTDVFQDGITSGQASTEWVIVDEGGKRNLFSEKGDSGSMVISPNGELVGLLIGGCEALGFTYMTPYATLVEDIERETGGTVELD